MKNLRLQIFRIKTVHTHCNANLRQLFNKRFKYLLQLIYNVGGTVGGPSKDAAEEREKVTGCSVSGWEKATGAEES